MTPWGRRRLGALLLLAGAVFSFAFDGPPASQKDGYGIAVFPDRASGIYQQSEEKITFTIRLTLNDAPVSDSDISYQVVHNGTEPVASGASRTVNGEAKVSLRISAPGSLMAAASCRLGEKGEIRAEAGAFVMPASGKVLPALPAPADFNSFWNEQKAKLAAVPLDAKMTPVELPAEFSNLTHLECFDVQVDCVGQPVSGYFCRPKNAKPKSLPGHLSLHGAGVRSANLAAAVALGNQGRLGMDINAHGLPNGKPDEFYRNLQTGELRDYPFIGSESRETSYFLGMYLRVRRALDFLASQPEWNGVLIASGGSQGGAQAIVAAGLDDRVTIVSAGLPALCDLAAQVQNRPAGWPVGTRKLTEKQLETFRYFDVCHFAARCAAKAIVRVGLADRTCWPYGVMAMIGQFPKPPVLITVPASSHTWSPAGSYAQSQEKLNALIAAEMEALKVR